MQDPLPPPDLWSTHRHPGPPWPGGGGCGPRWRRCWTGQRDPPAHRLTSCPAPLGPRLIEFPGPERGGSAVHRPVCRCGGAGVCRSPRHRVGGARGGGAWGPGRRPHGSLTHALPRAPCHRPQSYIPATLCPESGAGGFGGPEGLQEAASSPQRLVTLGVGACQTGFARAPVCFGA